MPLKRVKGGMLPVNNSVRNEAIRLLINKLGISKSSIFLRDNLSQDTDYLKIKNKLFADKSAGELYKEINK